MHCGSGRLLDFNAIMSLFHQTNSLCIMPKYPQAADYAIEKTGSADYEVSAYHRSDLER
jgi:hypothetical protein